MTTDERMRVRGFSASEGVGVAAQILAATPRRRGKHAAPWTAARADEDFTTTAAAPSIAPSTVGVSRGRADAEGLPVPDPRSPSTLNDPARDLMRATGFADGTVPAGEGVAPHSLIRRATPQRQLDTYDDDQDVDDVATVEPVRASDHRWLHTPGVIL